MNQITNPPNTYDFGLEFNYAVWTKDTQITLVNVPWNNDYRDIVKFGTRAELNTYINGLENSGIVLSQMSYVKPNEPIRIPVPFNAAYKYNYLRASNPLQPINGDVQKDFYYFITDVRYIAPNTTELVVQLDVWQTFGFDITFGNSYIERGHIGVANQNQMSNFGRDYLAIPEGLDTGGEYRVIYSNILWGYPASQAAVVVMSTVDLTQDGGSVDNPSLHSAKGGQYFGLASGASIYVWANASQFKLFLAGLQNQPWISQGIISVTMVPNLIQHYPDMEFSGSTAATIKEAPSGAPGVKQYVGLNNWRSSNNVLNQIPTRYRGLKKFLTFPYMAIELTTFSGTPAILRPENWNDANATLNEHIAAVAPDQRLILQPRGYNASSPSTLTDGSDDGGAWLDVFTMLGNFPSLAVVNNMALQYVAQNKNQIAWQYQSADWSQQRALGSNQVSYDQASSAMGLATKLTGIGTGAASAQTNLANDIAGQKMIVSAVGDILGGAAAGAVGGPAGVAVGAAGGIGAAVMGGIGTAIDNSARSQGTAISNSAARSGTKASNAQSGYVRDTNKDLADWAAQGDYANSIAGINAKVQDSRLTEPSTSGQVGGDAFAMANNFSGAYLRWKMIDPVAITVIGEYWLRYGYAVRKFTTPPASLQVMTKFTYWKMLETYMTGGGMPETFKQAIRGIFEKGVTVWASPTDIGNIDIADNTPLAGVTL